jgi:hypothetical protein
LFSCLRGAPANSETRARDGGLADAVGADQDGVAAGQEVEAQQRFDGTYNSDARLSPDGRWLVWQSGTGDDLYRIASRATPDSTSMQRSRRTAARWCSPRIGSAAANWCAWRFRSKRHPPCPETGVAISPLAVRWFESCGLTRVSPVFAKTACVRMRSRLPALLYCFV